MKFTIDDLMRNSFVISIGEETYKLFSGRMRKAGFTQTVMDYNGVIPRCLSGSLDKYAICSLNHFGLVNMARSLDLDHVTIFEYDAFPMIDCASKLSRMLMDGGVPDDADELQIGNLNFIKDYSNHNSYEGDVLVDVDDKLRWGRIKNAVWGAHAVVIFRKAYDTWLENYRRQKDCINPDFFNWLVPRCYSSATNYFIQVRDGKIDHGELLRDKEYLSDFPEITP